MAVTNTADAGSDPAIVEIIQTIEEGDVPVVNGDTRTWDVTDAVGRAIDDPTDARESERVLRLNSKSSVFGLKLVSYEDHYETSLHALESPDWTEDGQDSISTR